MYQLIDPINLFGAHIELIGPTMAYEPSECAICLEDASEAYTILPCCKNVLHTSCYMKCIAVNRGCPLCRSGAAPHLSIVVAIDDSATHGTVTRDWKFTLIGGLFACTVAVVGFVSTLVILSRPAQRA